MRVQYCSDLHLEDAVNNSYLKENPLKIAGDILILAGDIVPLHDMYLKDPFFGFLAQHFKQVFWVPGNHEFYHKEINNYQSSYNIRLNNKIRLVHNTEVIYENIRFVFSTLWAKISTENMKISEQSIPDFSFISINNKRFTVADFNTLHEESLTFLNAALQNKQEKTVVVTHHAPTSLSGSPTHKFSRLNEAFATGLDGMIAESEVNFWIYGHTHFNHFPFQIGKTILLTNQFGYKQKDECRDFRAEAYFTI